MANKSDKRIATENAATRQLLLYGTATTQLLQLFLFLVFSSQRTRSHFLLYVFTSLPSLFITLQLYNMAAPRYSASGALVSSGEDLSQSGLTQYMQDVVFVTWAAQLAGLVWSKGWWLYAIIPCYALYKVINLAAPHLFESKGQANQADTKTRKEADPTAGLSKRQQKMHARYEKGDKRYQMGQRQVPQ